MINVNPRVLPVVMLIIDLPSLPSHRVGARSRTQLFLDRPAAKLAFAEFTTALYPKSTARTVLGSVFRTKLAFWCRLRMVWWSRLE
jgi:hypothetical protein